jgi:hypothetical protein
MSAVAAKASKKIVVARAKAKSPKAATQSLLRDCGCPYGSACTCGPRLRIFDPMGRLLMSPVYY